MSKLAIMQPYLLPYIGYFQLINAVDDFVFYNDVDYIKNGWINRNRIMVNGKVDYFTIPCFNQSSNRKIKEITFNRNHPHFRKLIKKITQSYSKAPYFNEVFPLVEEIFNHQTEFISELSIRSIEAVMNYLSIHVPTKISSEHFSESAELKRAERIYSICSKVGANVYINPIGGAQLYFKEEFKKNNIDLKFIETATDQFKPEVNCSLSILDLLMNYSITEIKEFLLKYKLR